ncbi:MAG TPA: response regulator [Byssovorax sp.]|jgi:CheY-like chemotaxis protein
MPTDIEPPPLFPRLPRRIPFVRASGRVLVAEDDDDMRDLVAGALRLDGYDVVEVCDGGRFIVQVSEAYEQLDARTVFDLVVSDIRMPVASGLSVVETLRRAQWRTPVILMTAFVDDELRRRAKALDAVLFDKPFDIDDLRTIALNLLLRGPLPPSSSY